jgi:hypothetical protein
MGQRLSKIAFQFDCFFIEVSSGVCIISEVFSDTATQPLPLPQPHLRQCTDNSANTGPIDAIRGLF